MEIKFSKYFGACAGVNNAFNEVINFKEPNNLYILGELAHNEMLLSKIKEKNIKTIDNLSEIIELKNKKQINILIRTHGITKNVEDEIEKYGFNKIDKTCNKVKIIHSIIERKVNSCDNTNNFIIICGSMGHPEVIGIIGQIEPIKRKNVYVCSNLENLKEILSRINKTKISILFLAQTTFSIFKFNEMFSFLKKLHELDKINLKKYNTICTDFSNRCKEIIENNENFNVMIIVGSRKSSNTKELFYLASSICDETLFVRDICEIDFSKFSNDSKIFITSGSSYIKF